MSIRIILASRSPRTRQLMSSVLAGQDDLELVGEFDDPLQVLLEVKRERANVVVIDAEHPDKPGLETHLLAEYPDLLILGVMETGAFVEQLCPARSRLASDEPDEVAAVLRRRARTPCT